MMRVAPDNPEKPHGFESQFLRQGAFQAVVPFTSSNFSNRKTRWVDFGRADTESVGQAGTATDPASNTVLRVASAHAVRASLFTSEQATRRLNAVVSAWCAQVASGPVCRVSRCM